MELDTIIEGVKIGSILVGGSTITLATIFDSVAGIMKIAEEKYVREKVKQRYFNK